MKAAILLSTWNSNCKNINLTDVNIDSLDFKSLSKICIKNEAQRIIKILKEWKWDKTEDSFNSILLNLNYFTSLLKLV